MAGTSRRFSCLHPVGFRRCRSVNRNEYSAGGTCSTDQLLPNSRVVVLWSETAVHAAGEEARATEPRPGIRW